MDGSGSAGNLSFRARCQAFCDCMCKTGEYVTNEGEMDGRRVSPAPTEGDPEEVIDTQPTSQEPETETDLDDRHVDSKPETKPEPKPEPETEPSTVVYDTAL